VVADSAQKCSSCLEWINLAQKPPWAAEVQALWQVVFDYARSQKAGGRGTAEADMAGLGRAVYERVAQLIAEGRGPPWLGRLPPH
jgi:hypothetical protein